MPNAYYDNVANKRDAEKNVSGMKSALPSKTMSTPISYDQVPHPFKTELKQKVQDPK